MQRHHFEMNQECTDAGKALSLYNCIQDSGFFNNFHLEFDEHELELDLWIISEYPEILVKKEIERFFANQGFSIKLVYVGTICTNQEDLI